MLPYPLSFSDTQNKPIGYFNKYPRGRNSGVKTTSTDGVREAKWVGQHPSSLKLQKVSVEEFLQTFNYGLKDITKLDDFNQVVDWGNGYFNQESNY